MPLIALADLAAAATPATRVLGLDLGTKTIGVAACTWLGGIAEPLVTIRRAKFSTDAAEVFRLMERQAATHLILGLPLNMDGSAGARVQSTRAFASNLLRLRDIPILLHDERLTTVEAEDLMARAGIPAGRRRALVDAAAAAVIIEDARRLSPK
jgi:putative Holliday junction resolvase